MTTGLLVLMAVLIALGKFLDFLLGKSGDRRIKAKLQRLADDQGLQRSNQWHYARHAAVAVEEFLDDFFGPQLSVKCLQHCFFLSVILTGLLIFAISFTDELIPNVLFPQEAGGDGMALKICLVLLSNFVVDYLSLATTRLVLNKAITASDSRLWRYVLLEILLTYVFVITAMNFTFSSIIFVEGLAEGYFFDTLDAGNLAGFLAESGGAWWVLFTSYTIPNLLSPVAEGQMLAIGSTNLLVFSITAALPSIIFVIAIGGAMLVDSVDHLIGDAVVSRVLARLAQHEKPVFLNLSVALSAVVTLVGSMA